MNQMPCPNYIITQHDTATDSQQQHRVDTCTSINQHIKAPTFTETYEYFIKPIKEHILLKDPSAKFQIEEIKTKKGKMKILLKMTGSALSAEMLSQIDPNYEWNGKYYIYCFKCNSLNINETLESFDEYDHTINERTQSIVVYKKVSNIGEKSN